MKRKCTLLLLLSAIIFQQAFAQNCTVNAGVPLTLCPNEPITLNGNISGLYNSANVSWTQVSGPAVVIANPNSLTTAAGVLAGGATYVFRLSSLCQDGNTATDDVTFTVQPLTPHPPAADAGADISAGCIQFGQSIPLNATPASPGFTGTWTVVGAVSGTFSNPNDPASLFIPAQPNAGNPDWKCGSGTYTLRWTLVSNVPPACTSSQTSTSDEVVVSASPWNTVDARVVNTCGSINTFLYGTCTGSSTPTWSLVSGPVGYTFTPVNTKEVVIASLPAGSYTFRYDVAGACVSGSRDVSFTIAAGQNSPITASVANSGNIQTIYCGSFPTPLQLSANTVNAGETGTWTQTAGGTGVSFSDIHDPLAAVSGMTAAGGSYTFTWTVANSAGCFNSSDVTTSILEVRQADTVRFSTSCNNVVGTPSLCGRTTTLVGFTTDPLQYPPSLMGWYMSGFTLLSKPAGSSATLGATPAVTQFNVTPGGHGSQATDCIGLGFDAVYNGSNLSSSFGMQAFEGIVPGTYTGIYNMRNTLCDQALEVPCVITISGPANISNAGTDQLLACNVTQTNLAGNDPIATAPNFGMGEWLQVSGPNTAVIANRLDRNTQISSLVAGTYVFKWRIDGGDGCTSLEDLVKVRVSNTPPAAITAGTDQNVCFGTPVQLTADLVPSGNINTMLLSTGSTGTWTQVAGPAGVVFTDASNPTTTVSGLVANSVYTFRFTAANLCGSTQADVNFTTGSTQGGSAADAGTGACLASGVTTVNLTAIAPATGTGMWSKENAGDPGTITDPSAASTTITGLNIPGIYGYVWTVTGPGGCADNTDTVWFSNEGPLAAAVAGPDQQVCEAAGINSFQLNATPPATGTGEWIQVSGPPASFIAALPNTAVTVSEGGHYVFRWVVTHKACGVVMDDVVIDFHNQADLASVTTADAVLCSGSSGLISLNAVAPASGTGVWTITSGAAVIDNSLSAITNATVNPGSTTFRWTVSSNADICPASFDEVTVQYHPGAANAMADIALCKANSALLTGSDPFTGSGVWSVVSQPMASPAVNFIQQGNDSTYAISPLVTGTYTFRWTVNSGPCGITADDMILRIDDITTPNAGADICGTVGTPLNLSGSVPAPGTSSTWTLFSNPAGAGAGSFADPSMPATTYAPADVAGTYNFRYEYTSGVCALSDYVSLRVMPTVNAFAQANYCDNAAGLDLTGSDPFPGNGSWSVVSSPPATPPVIFTNENTPFANVRGLGPGTYTFRYTVSDAFCAGGTQDVVVNSTCFVLPVTINNFSVKTQSCSNELKWISAEESNFAHYQVEYSSNGTNFETIATLISRGSNSTYSFIHKAGNGMAHYRLRLTDQDGRFKYSTILSTRNDCNKTIVLVYPVPADEQLVIDLAGTTVAQQAAIWSADGKLVRRLILQPGKNTINTNLLANGIYTLTVQDKNEASSKYKIIVQH